MLEKMPFLMFRSRAPLQHGGAWLCLTETGTKRTPTRELLKNVDFEPVGTVGFVGFGHVLSLTERVSECFIAPRGIDAAGFDLGMAYVSVIPQPVEKVRMTRYR